MKIRQATITDLTAITQIEQLCFTSAQAATKESFEQRLRTFPDSFFIAVATEQEEVIGFVNSCVTDSRVIRDEMYANANLHNPDGDYQAIFGLAVAPEHRGKGAAKGLIQELISLTKSRNKKGVILTCEESMIGFYRALRFELLGVSESKHGGAVWHDMILEFGREI